MRESGWAIPAPGGTATLLRGRVPRGAAGKGGCTLMGVPGNPNHEITVIRTETGTHSRPNFLSTISCELAAALPS